MGIMSEMDLEQWERNVDEGCDLEEENEPAAEDEAVSGILASIRAFREQPEEAPVEPAAGKTEAVGSSQQPAGAAKKVPAGDSAREEDKGRQEHEAAEAKRKAEWEAKQKAKKEKEAAELAKINAMSDEEALAASVKQAGEQTERLTRRNMKLFVTDVIQEKCRRDPVFARLVLNPKKDMAKCFRYINRHARKFIEDEMKANGEERAGGMMGGDVPDDVCYQWAEEYFRDLEAEEDRENEEKFVPKPYISSSGGKNKAKKTEEKKPEPKPAAPKKQAPVGQIGFGEMLGAA